jgi:hypothetical protein
MGNNPFISHRMFVAALNGENRAPNQHAPAAQSEAGSGPPVNLSPEQLAALAAKHWLDFPFARPIQPSAS